MAREKSATRVLTEGFVNTPMEGEYKFTTSAGRGLDTVHRIRVDLSRIRAKLIARKYKLRQFKLLIIDITTRDGRDHVTLKKSQTVVQSTLEVLPEMILGNKGIQTSQAGSLSDGDGSEIADSAVKAGA